MNIIIIYSNIRYYIIIFRLNSQNQQKLRIFSISIDIISNVY